MPPKKDVGERQEVVLRSHLGYPEPSRNLEVFLRALATDRRACRSKVRRIQEDNQLKSGGNLPEMHSPPAHCPIQGLHSLHEAEDR